MIPLRLPEIAAATGGRLRGGSSVADRTDLEVTAVSTDSRAIVPGALFVALRGEADGHAYVGAAVQAGAAAVMVERDVDVDAPGVTVADTWEALRRLAAEVRRRVDPTTVAITGSVGKTTVKDLTAAAVSAGRRCASARGSYNNELGVPLTVLGLRPDTEVLVTELGARHVGDIASLAAIVEPDLAVVTAVAGVHLEIFGSIDAVARAKAELVEALGPGGVAILNVADPRVAAMAARAPSVLRVGLDVDDADVRADRVVLDRRARPTAAVTTPWGATEVRLPVAGRHQVTNALLALAVAGEVGVDLDDAAAAIAQAPISPWRGEVVEAGGIVVLNDAYNANPTSVVAALETLVAIERTGSTWAVLGVMAEIGPTSAAEHRAVGRHCAELGIDVVVAVGPDAAAVAAGALEAGMGDDAVVRVPDGDAASTHLRAGVAAGDVVLVKASRVAGLEAVATNLLDGLAAGNGSRSGEADAPVVGP